MPRSLGIGLGLEAGGARWSPALLAGATALWTAAAGLFQDDALATPAAADTVVGAWQSQGGLGLSVRQAVTGLKPVYRAGACPSGLGAVQFDGVDDLLATSSALGVATIPVLTWAVACRPATVASGYRRILALYATTSTRYRALRSDFSPAYFEYAWRNDDLTQSSFHVGATGVAWYVLVLRDNAGLLDHWINGVRGGQQAYASGVTTPTSFAIGSGASGSAPFSGHIAMVATFNTALSDTECAAVSRWMGDCVGVSA